MQDMTEKTDCPVVGTFCPNRLAALDNNNVPSQSLSPAAVYKCGDQRGQSGDGQQCRLGHQRITGEQGGVGH
jgi:hypothetical protein